MSKYTFPHQMIVCSVEEREKRIVNNEFIEEGRKKV